MPLYPTLNVDDRLDTHPLISEREDRQEDDKKPPIFAPMDAQTMMEHEKQLLNDLPPEFKHIDTSKFLVHRLDRVNDSLVSLAIRYQVHEEDIKRLNQFSDLDLFPKEYILIPRMDVSQLLTVHRQEKRFLDEELQKQQKKHESMAKTISQMYDIPVHEAYRCLECNTWDLEKTRQQIKEAKLQSSLNHRELLHREEVNTLTRRTKLK
jgi:hypothetical protein